MFLLQLMGWLFVFCIVSNLLGCGKDIVKAGRIKFKKWLESDTDNKDEGG